MDQYNPGTLFDAELLFEHAPCGYCSFLATGELVRINTTLQNWLGYGDKSEILGRIIRDLFTQSGKIYYELVFLPMVSIQHHVKELNFEIKRADGTSFPALVNATLTKGEQGQQDLINLSIIDITDRKRYESDLLETKRNAEYERKKFEFLSDNSPELVWSANELGNITGANKRFLTYFKLSNLDFAIPAIMKRIHNLDRYKLSKAWLKCIKDGTHLEVQVRIQGKNDLYRWFSVRAESFHDAPENMDRWIGSFSDIDAHVAAAEKREEFLNVAGHEIKTPITSLKASLQLLDRMKHTMDSPVHKRLIEQSNENVDKVIRLFNELLVAGKHNDGILQLNKTWFDLSDMLDNCCVHVRLSDTHKIVEQGDLHLNVFADKQRIDQVIVNFVNNAVKYAPESKTIYILTEQSGTYVKVSVSDKGPGISKEKLPDLFKRYFRGGQDNQTAGLGLGLYICADIIERHGGQIGVQSEPGKGTTFWFTIPVGVLV